MYLHLGFFLEDGVGALDWPEFFSEIIRHISILVAAAYNYFRQSRSAHAEVQKEASGH